MHGEVHETATLTEQKLGRLMSHLLNGPGSMPTRRVSTFVDDMKQLGEHGGIGKSIVSQSKGVGLARARRKDYGCVGFADGC